MAETSRNVELNRVTCTPHTQRRSRQQFETPIGMDDNDMIDILELHDLVGLTWTVYAVSALFSFQHDDVQLKLYSKKLKEEIAARLSYKDLTYDAKISVLQNVALRPDQEPCLAIKIEVTGKNIGDENNKEKSLYKGILLSWNLTQIRINIPNSTNLPLLLCRGTYGCMNAVHSIVNSMFDCLIMPLPVNETDLNWLLPIVIMTADTEKKFVISGKVNMEYTIPDLPVTDKIRVKFDVAALRKILMAITNQEEETTVANVCLKFEHIEKFRQVLHTQMLEVGRLQLGLCTLRRIELPGVTIMENKMKILKAECMNVILLYLYEKAFDIFHTIHIGT